MTLLTGDALTVLKMLPENSVHCCVTSPPYYSQRKYNAGPGEMGSEATPEEHIAALVAVFREVRRVLRLDGICFINYGDKAANSGSGLYSDGESHGTEGAKSRSSLGSVGQTTHKDARYRSGEFFQLPWNLALALRADGWVLHPEIIWRKLSAMPESISGTRWEKHRVKMGSARIKFGQGIAREGTNLSPIGKPIGSSLAMQGDPDRQPLWADCPGCERCAPNDGLVLRRGSWRPTRSHEYLFMLTKTERFYADQEAMREKAIHEGRVVKATGDKSANAQNEREHNNRLVGGFTRHDTLVSGRNPRSVQTFTSSPLTDRDYADGYAPAVTKRHFAVFPVSLPTWCIKVSTSEKGVCPACGAQWARVIDKAPGRIRGGAFQEDTRGHEPSECVREDGQTSTLGWRAICEHGDLAPIPATVLDPFCGSGTTLLAAHRLGRDGIGIELSPEYAAFAEKRLREDAPMLTGAP